MRRRIPPIVWHVVRRVGYRGYFLLTLAVVDVFQGLNFVRPGSSVQASSNVFIAEAIPFGDLDVRLWAWALAWWAVAVFCVWNAFKTSRDHWGYLSAIFIKVAYVTVLVYGTTHGMPDGWRRVTIWAWFASTVWVMSRLPEPPWTLIDMDSGIREAQEHAAEVEKEEDGDDA